jgi:hypothetical protein
MNPIAFIHLAFIMISLSLHGDKEAHSRVGWL